METRNQSGKDFRPIIQRDKRALSASIEDLKQKYMCETNEEKLLEFCENCSGQGICFSGQRAVQLLDEGAEDKPQTKAVSQTTQKVNPKSANDSTPVNNDLQKYIDVLKAKDPIQYLLDHGTTTEHAAKEWLRRRKIKYPDAYKKYVESNPNHPLNSSSGTFPVQEPSIVDSKDEFTVNELLESIGEIVSDDTEETVEPSAVEEVQAKAMFQEEPVKGTKVETEVKPAKQNTPVNKSVIAVASSDSDITASDLEVAKRVLEKRWYDLEESKAKFMKQIEEHKQAIVKCQEEIDKISAVQDSISDTVLPLL